jgi:hypothetical protein
MSIHQDDTSAKPLIIDFDGEEIKAPTKKKSLQSSQPSLGRPPKPCSGSQCKPAPKVRLCSELAGHAAIPAGLVLLIACIVAASHSEEDHSFSAIQRTIATAVEEVFDYESWWTWLICLSVGIFIIAGSICTYICYSAVASSSPLKNAQDRKAVLREDTLSHSNSRRRYTGLAASIA